MNNGVESNTSNGEQEPERKNSVLQSHGYKLGRTIGSGSYAIIKVKKIFINLIIYSTKFKSYINEFYII